MPHKTSTSKGSAMFRRIFTTATATVAAAALAATAHASTAPAPKVTGQTIVSAAAIRVTPDNGCVPVIHRNGAHPAPGIDRLEIVPGGIRNGKPVDAVLRVYMTHSSPVVHPEIQPDEVIGTGGISAGISGGVGHANVYFWDRNGNYVHPSKACGPSANWWLRIESQPR